MVWSYFNNLEQGQTELTNFKSEHIEDFHWSFDGSKLGIVHGSMPESSPKPRVLTPDTLRVERRLG